MRKSSKDSVHESQRDMRKLTMALNSISPTDFDIAAFEKKYAKELMVLEAIEKMMEEDKAQSASESTAILSPEGTEADKG